MPSGLSCPALSSELSAYVSLIHFTKPDSLLFKVEAAPFLSQMLTQGCIHSSLHISGGWAQSSPGEGQRIHADKAMSPPTEEPKDAPKKGFTGQPRR